MLPLINILRPLATAIQWLWQFILLPLTPEAFDRLNAQKIYEDYLEWHPEAIRKKFHQRVRALLYRTAKRQVLLNTSGRIWFAELEARKWERSYNYALVFRCTVFSLALLWGSHCLDLLLGQHWPEAYVHVYAAAEWGSAQQENLVRWFFGLFDIEV